jgi:hypothetical protein
MLDESRPPDPVDMPFSKLLDNNIAEQTAEFSTGLD